MKNDNCKFKCLFGDCNYECDDRKQFYKHKIKMQKKNGETHFHGIPTGAKPNGISKRE